MYTCVYVCTCVHVHVYVCMHSVAVFMHMHTQRVPPRVRGGEHFFFQRKLDVRMTFWSFPTHTHYYMHSEASSSHFQAVCSKVFILQSHEAKMTYFRRFLTFLTHANNGQTRDAN